MLPIFLGAPYPSQQHENNCNQQIELVIVYKHARAITDHKTGMTLTTMNSNKENAINMKEFGFSMRTRNTLHSTYDTELLSSELFSIEQLRRHGGHVARTIQDQLNCQPERNHASCVQE